MERGKIRIATYIVDHAMSVCNMIIRLLLLLAVFSPPAFANAWEPPESIQAAAESFVRQKTENIEGEVNITSTPPDKRAKVPKCNALETSMPASNRPWGRSSVKVSCSAPAKWTLYVPVMVRVTGRALVTTRAIGGGQVIGPQDVLLQELELSAYPPGIFTRPEQAVGKTTATSITSGAPVRAELLRAPLAIRHGQQVVVVAYGANFKVSSEGTAMGNAQPGQVVTVKTKSGQTIKGIARGDGMVEVAF